MKSNLPGPKGKIRPLIQFAANPLEFLTNCAREYGDMVKINTPLGPTYLISDPADVENVLVTTNRNFNKGKMFDLIRPILGNGLVTSGGDFWLRQRRMIQPAFHRERIRGYAQTMVDYTDQMLAGWQEGQIRNIQHDMQQLTLQIVSKLLFNTEVSSEEAGGVGRAMEDSFKVFQAKLSSPIQIPENVPTPGNLRYRKAVRQLDQIIYGIIEESRAANRDNGDLLSVLLQMQDEDGSRMSDQQLRDELITMFVAGHETTALAMTWALYLLSQHPEIEARLVEELETVLNGRNPTVEDLPRLRYTELIVKETLRLYPPALLIPRGALQEYEIQGHKLQPGDQLWMLTWAMHRDPRYYDEPEEFKPERWESEKIKSLPKYSYMPFGGGPRLCIGNTFALTELALLLATIVSQYKFSLVPGKPVLPHMSATLRPKYPVYLKLAQRLSSAKGAKEMALAGAGN